MRNDEKNTYSDDGKVFCQQCGAKIDENDVHCPNCGAFQGERYVEMPDDPADAPVYKKKGGSIPLIIGIILISLLIVAVSVIWFTVRYLHRRRKPPKIWKSLMKKKKRQ